MRECDNNKIHISSNFLLSICLLIITLQHFATLHHTSPNCTSLHLSTLLFLSFTLHFLNVEIVITVLQRVRPFNLGSLLLL